MEKKSLAEMRDFLANYNGEKLHITLVVEPQGTDENPNTRLFCA